MCFENFLNEIAVANVELQTSDIRADAKTIIAKTRGLMPGRIIDANGDSSTSNKPSGADAFTPDNPRATSSMNMQVVSRPARSSRVLLSAGQPERFSDRKCSMRRWIL